MASTTCLNQTGSMVAEVPMNGIILPPFCCLTAFMYVPAEPMVSVRMTSGCVCSIEATSVRYDAAPRWMAWLMAIVTPSLFKAATAGPTNVWEPMSSPNTSATFLYGAWFGPYRALPIIAYASNESGGTSRWKYLALVLLNSDWPVMQNMGMWERSRIGTTVDASSEVQPTTPIRFDLRETSALAAGTAPAGSPRASNRWQLTWRPPMPPAPVIDSEAA